jgi:hypothetical protein
VLYWYESTSTRKHLKLVIRVEELPAWQRSSVYVLYWRFTGTKVQILVLGGVAP